MNFQFRMESEPDHENMVIMWNQMVAAGLQQGLRDRNMDEAAIWPLVESLTFDLAMLLDDATFTINGKVYRPRIAFADEDGALLPGAAEFDYAHEYATVFEEDLHPTEDFSITR